jgi:hypothetical protein
VNDARLGQPEQPSNFTAREGGRTGSTGGTSCHQRAKASERIHQRQGHAVRVHVADLDRRQVAATRNDVVC